MEASKTCDLFDARRFRRMTVTSRRGGKNSGVGRTRMEAWERMWLHMTHRPKALPLWNVWFDMPWARVDAEATLVGRTLDTVDRLGQMPASLDSGVQWMRDWAAVPKDAYRKLPYFGQERQRCTRDREIETRWRTNAEGGGQFVPWHHLGVSIPLAQNREVFMSPSPPSSCDYKRSVLLRAPSPLVYCFLAGRGFRKRPEVASAAQCGPPKDERTESAAASAWRGHSKPTQRRAVDSGEVGVVGVQTQQWTGQGRGRRPKKSYFQPSATTSPGPLRCTKPALVWTGTKCGVG